MKKKVISYKEYAEICLNCPEKKCIQTFRGCKYIKPYRTIEHPNVVKETNNDSTV